MKSLLAGIQDKNGLLQILPNLPVFGVTIQLIFNIMIKFNSQENHSFIKEMHETLIL